MQNPSIQTAIQDMLQMQNSLNEMTNGSDWRLGKTLLGKHIDWRRCIVMETAELIDSYPWKHWKAVEGKIDLENVRVELVDIWHFLLSLTLENLDMKPAEQILLKVIESSQLLKETSYSLSIIEQVEVHETMMRTALERSDVSETYLFKLIDQFFKSCLIADLSFDDLYQIYMAKNVLNKFRQDNGYKEGTYIKEWNGKEDNVVMFEIIAQMDDFSGEQLYSGLQQNYSKLVLNPG